MAFVPNAVLYDEEGHEVAREADVVELPQVWRGQARGTTADPYFAAGLLFDGCYPRQRADPVQVGEATWRVDTALGEPSAETTSVELRVVEQACSGPQPAGDRLTEPSVEYSDDAVVITLGVAGMEDVQCVGPNPESSFTVELTEPLGERRLLDGAVLPAAQRWPTSEFPVIEVGDLGESLEERLVSVMGPEGCPTILDVDAAPWPIARIEREAAELPGGVGRVGPGNSIYVGQPEDAAAAFGGFEALHDEGRWGLVGPYVDEPWLTGFGIEGEWVAAEMAEIELAAGRSAWAAGIYVTVIGQDPCRE